MRRQCEGEPDGGYEPKVPIHMEGRLHLGRTACNARRGEHAAPSAARTIGWQRLFLCLVPGPVFGVLAVRGQTRHD